MMINEQNSFQAMVFFLEKYYERTNCDAIGSLLGDLQLLEDGKPADPAAWNDWLEAIKMSMSIDPAGEHRVHD